MMAAFRVLKAASWPTLFLQAKNILYKSTQSSYSARSVIAVAGVPVGSSSCRAAQELLCLSIQNDTVRF